MGRGLMILLVVSLGLNIFALGHFSGRLLAGDKPPSREHIMHGHHGKFGDPFHVMGYADELSPELRQRFRAEIKKELPSLREHHDQMKELRRELGDLMSADEWDGEAIAAKLDEIGALQDSQRRAFNRAFMSAFEALPAEQRKLLIETAKERRAERRRIRKLRYGDDDHHPPPPPDEPPPEELDAPPED